MKRVLTMTRVLMIVAVAGLLMVEVPGAKAQTSDPPDPETLVPKTVAAGQGQLLTIQGFNLFVPGLTTVTLWPSGGGPPNHCVVVVGAASSSEELYVRLGVFESVPPPGCLATIPSIVPPGKYKLTVTTPRGTSGPLGLYVKETPEAPIPRRLLYCSTSPCAPGFTFSPGDVMGILAYGTDGVGATAVFIQGTTAMAVPSSGTFLPTSPNEHGVVNAFFVPTGLAPGPALVRLQTTVTAIGGGQPDPGESPLSFALVFEVASPTGPPSD